MTPGYTPCPHSLEPDGRGEPHPHQTGEYRVLGVRVCAVCEREITVADWDRVWRAEARRELARIVGYEYWRQTPSAQDEQPAGASPAPGPRASGPERKRT